MTFLINHVTFLNIYINRLSDELKLKEDFSKAVRDKLSPLLFNVLFNWHGLEINSVMYDSTSPAPPGPQRHQTPEFST